MTNLERAMELMQIPCSKLPQLAKDFAKHLVSTYGLCMEVMITAFAAYAQCIEGCRCDDSNYDGKHHQQWFDERLEQQAVYVKASVAK